MTPTTAFKRRSSPRCGPTPGCVRDRTCTAGCSRSPTARRSMPTARAAAGAYAIEPSPLGDLLVAVTARGLVNLSYEEGERDALLDRLATRISPRVVEAPARLDPVRRELDEYFAGARRSFETPVDWRLTRGFTRRVLRATARIPYGSASTYREVAGRAGSERAVRAAGNALGANPIPI